MKRTATMITLAYSEVIQFGYIYNWLDEIGYNVAIPL